MAEKKKATSRDSLARIRTVFFWIMTVFALVGLADAIYLTVAHIAGDYSICGESHGCSVVLGSKYAAVGPVPTAAFGALGYFAVFGLALLAAFGYRRVRMFLGIVLGSMFTATLWLLYLQAFMLREFCPFCLFSAAVVFVLAGLLLATPPSE
jgi:uncharacterized membrane protein